MGKIQLLRHKRLLITTASVISIFLLIYIGYQAHIRNQNIINSHKATIQAMEQQLAAEKQGYMRMIDNFKRTQKSRIETEAKLAEMEDWQTRYESAMDDNKLLSEEIVQREHQHEIDLARLKRAMDFLSAENDSIKADLYLAESVRNELDEKYLGATQSWETGSQALKQELNKNEREITRLLEKIKDLETEKSEPEKAPVASQKKPDINPDIELKIANIPDPVSTPVGNSKSDAYRHVRLQSLKSALLKQDSPARRKILLSVIPTIPEGISGTEFSELVSDMGSADILAVLQGADKFINRPLDDKIISTLTSRMSDNDAKSATLILLKQQ